MSEACLEAVMKRKQGFYLYLAHQEIKNPRVSSFLLKKACDKSFSINAKDTSKKEEVIFRNRTTGEMIESKVVFSQYQQ